MDSKENNNELNDDNIPKEVNQKYLREVIPKIDEKKESKKVNQYNTIDSKKITKNVRRRHLNSKNGCKICKQKRLKCDEQLPVCSYCERKNLSCSYLTMTPFQINRIQESQSFNQQMKNKGVNVSTIKHTQYINLSANTCEKSAPKPQENEQEKDYGYSLFEQPKEYQYVSSREIKLNAGSLPQNNTTYKMHEMEGILLPPSFTNQFVFNTNANNSLDNINNIIHSTSNFEIVNNKCDLNPAIKSDMPLFHNTTVSERLFNINHNKWVAALEQQERKKASFMDLVYQGKFKELDILKGRSVDCLLMLQFYHTLNTCTLFDKLLRNSCFLFAMDYYKNTLLKQNMLSKLDYRTKIAICYECDKNSVVSIDNISKIIKNEYLSVYNCTDKIETYVLMGSFHILNTCLGYHFKAGKKYDLSYNDSKKAVQLSGIFLTGLYSLVMDRSTEELINKDIALYANYLFMYFKTLLLDNYSFEIFNEFTKTVESLAPKYGDDIDFENLRLFCEKYSNLFSANLKEESLLGVSNTYLIRVTNSFLAILPYTFTNIDMEDVEKGKLNEREVLTILCYITLSYILSACFPGSRSIIGNPIAGLRAHFFSIKSVMNLLTLFEDKDLLLAGIYMIRVQSFFKSNKTRAIKILSSYSIGSIIKDDPNTPMQEQYIKVKSLKRKTIADQIQLRTFSLHKAQFIKDWNYYNLCALKPKKNNKVSENKIMNHFKNYDELIDDFIDSNNGFFSLDDDGQFSTEKENIAKETKPINGYQIKMIWKLITYIRINDL